MQLNSIEEVTGRGDPVTLTACVGSLTRTEARRLRDQLLLSLRYGPRHLLLDLSEIDDIDNLAVALLLDTQRRSFAAHCTLMVIAPSQPVVRRLRSTGVFQLLVVHRTLVAALTALDANRRGSDEVIDLGHDEPGAGDATIE